MKKLILAILLCLPLLASAQEATNVVYVTNTLTVVVTEAEETRLRIAWRLKNWERTNAVPALPPLTFRQCLETEAGPAIVQRVTSELEAQREAIILARYREADEAKRLAILREALKP